jgi:gliding motility-associated-like protein
VFNGNTLTASGIYTDTLTSVNGCDSTATLNLTINQPTTSTTTQVACSSYTWNGTTYSASGTYTYTTTNANGCDSTATLNLTINLPTISITNQVACLSYTWNGNTYNVSGSYTYTTTNANGCDSIATLNLTINTTPQPVVLLSGPSNICQGQSVILSLANSGLYSQYIWNNGSSNDSIVVDTSGTYNISVTDFNGCSGDTSVSIIVTPCVFTFTAEYLSTFTNRSISASIYANETNLSGITLDTIPLLSPLFGTVSVSSSGEFTYTPQINYSGYDKFVIKGCNIFNNCSYDTVYIQVRPLAQNDYYTTNGYANAAAATGNVTDNDGGLGIIGSVTLISNVSNGTLQIDSEGKFLYRPNRNYCGLDSFRYQICDTNNLCSVATCVFEVICRDVTVFTGFSPNGDGINDGWVLPDIEGTNNKVSIFDRWGSLVRSFTNYDNVNIFWDGTNRAGVLLPSGTYFYSIEVEGKQAKKGWVEITR